MSDDARDEPDEPGLGLDEVLAALRHDLVAARDDAGRADGGYGLGVSEVEVELSVEVSRSVRGEGSVGAKWFVLSGDASGEASRDRSRAHRIKLTLRPTADADEVAVGEALPADGEGVGRSDAAETIAPIGPRIAGDEG